MENNEIIVKFTNSLNELIEEGGYGTTSFARAIGVDKVIVHRWRRYGKDVRLNTLLKLADFFDCSIEYLCGKTDERLDYTPVKELPPLGEHIKKVLATCGVSAYRMMCDTGIKRAQYQHWREGSLPRLSSVETVAKYLSVTIDYLIGRDGGK